MVYASKHGFTKGIAEYIKNKMTECGVSTDLREASGLQDVTGYDAFVIGSAVYFGKWRAEAREFVTRNQKELAHRPVWLFSSGPTGTNTRDKNGRDLREASVPEDIGDFKKIINPRDHHVFYGGYDSRSNGGISGWFVRRIPAAQRALFEGDFRNWDEIGSWAEGIAKELRA